MLTREQREKQQREITTALSSLKGFGAQVWSYVVTHAELTIRLAPVEGKTNAHVVCGGCESVCLPTNWPNADLRVEVEVVNAAGDTVDAPDGRERYRLRMFDEQAKVAVCCAGIDILRDVPPIF